LSFHALQGSAKIVLTNSSIPVILNISKIEYEAERSMTKLLRVSDRHQITIPSDVMRDAGISEGSYLAIRAREGKIVLEPQEISQQEFSREDWDALDRLLRRQVALRHYTEYPSPRDAKKHLK